MPKLKLPRAAFYKFAFAPKPGVKGELASGLNPISGLQGILAVAFKQITALKGTAVVLSILAFLPLGLKLATPQTVSAATPTLTFQARLESNTGAIAPDGNYNIEFNLYEGGTVNGGGTKKWTEDHTNTTTTGIRVVNGYFSVNLGSVTNFPSTINWDDDLFLSMTMGGTTTGPVTWDSEMTPYLKLTAVPYAMQSQSASQLQTSNSGHTGTLAFDSLTADQSILIPQSTAPTDTVCLVTLANCTAATGDFIQNQNVAAQPTSNFWIDGTGTAATLQAGTLDAAVAGALNIGLVSGGNATAINLNQNTSLAAGKTLTVTSGATSLTGATTGDALTVSNNTSTGNVAVFKDNTTAVVTIADGGAVTLQNSVDSAAALQVQNTAGGNLFSIGTTSKTVTIGAATTPLINDPYTTTPTGALSGSAIYVTGQYVQLNNGAGTSGRIEYNPAVSTNFDANFQFSSTGGADAEWFYAYNTSSPSEDTGNYGGYQFSFNEHSNAIRLYYAGTLLASASQAGMGTGAWHNGEIIKTGTNLKVYYDGSLLINYTDITRTLTGTKFGFGAWSGGQSGTHLVRNFSLAATTAPVVGNVNFTVNGTALVQTGTNSSTALQVQNASGAGLLTADTSGMAVTVGGSLNVSGDVAFQHGTDFSTVGTSNDVNFGSGVLFRLTGASAQTITGIAGGTDGRMITLVNAGTTDATLMDISDSTGSTSGNLIVTGTGSDLSIAAGASVSLIYDSQDSVWRVIGTISGVASGSNYVTLQGGTPGTPDVGNLNINGTGVFGTALQAPSLDTASAGALNIGLTSGGNATAINLNQNVQVAAGKTLTLTGGTTASRPASPTEGMLYYDTTTKRLLVYSNGKWQADRTAATVIVGTSASGGTSGAVASNNPDGADYVNTSTTSAQTVINSALSSLSSSGGTVYLMEGTYVIDGSISIPNNVTLAGAGAGTIIKLKNGINANINAITNTDTSTGTGVVVTNLQLDGNKANQTTGSQYGIDLDHMGATTPRAGAKLTLLQINNFRSIGVYLTNSNLTTITNNQITNAGSDGIYIINSQQDTIQNNILQNDKAGIYIGTSGSYLDVTENVIAGNSDYGIDLDSGSSNNVISLNSFKNNGGSSNNDAIFLLSSTGNMITGNNIADDTATTTNYGIHISDSGSSTNYLSDNLLGGSSVSDAGTGTIYSGQSNGSTYLLQPNTDIMIGSTDTASSTTLQAGTGGLVLQTGATTGNSGMVSIMSGASSSGTSGNVQIDVGASGTGASSGVYSTGFEGCATGIWISWYGSSNVAASNVGGGAHGGSCVLSLKETGSSWGVQTDAGQLISVVGGQQYTFSYWLKAATAGESDVEGYVQWSDGSSTHITPQAITTAGWTEYSLTTIAPADATNFYLEVTGDSGATNNIVYLDDVSVTTDTSPGVSIGTSNAQYVTIGNSSAALTLQAGSSGISLNGTTTVSGDLTVTNAGNVAFQHGTDYSTTGTSNDVDFGGGVLFRLTGASAQTITGIAGGTDGRMITLVNAGTTTATLMDISDSTGSTSGNLIVTGTGSDLSIAAGASVSLIYDSQSSVWRVIGTISGVASGSNYVTLQNITPGTPDVGNLDVNGTGVFGMALQAPSLDMASAGTLSLGTGANSSSVSISKSGATTTVNGSLSVVQDATFDSDILFDGSMAHSITVGNSGAGSGNDLTINGGIAGSSSPPTIVGQTITYVNNASSVTASYPSGMQVGDIMVMTVGHWWNVTNPSGWTALDNSTGTNVNGGLYWKTVTAGDVGGSQAISFGGGGYGEVDIVAVRNVTGVHDFVASRSSTGSTSENIGSVDVNAGDFIIYSGEARLSSATIGLTTGSVLAQRQTDANAGAVVGYSQAAAGGTVSQTFTVNSTPSGRYYTIVSLSIDTSSTGNGGNVVLSGGSAAGTGTPGGVIVKNAGDSTTAFQVQGSSGATSFLRVDTSIDGDGLVASNGSGNGNIAVFQDNFTPIATFANGGAVSFQNSSDTASAFQVLNSIGGNLLSVGTLGNTVSLGAISTPVIDDPYTTTPTGTLQGTATYVAGQYVQLNTSTSQTGLVEYNPALSTNFDATFQFWSSGSADDVWLYAYDTSSPSDGPSGAGGYHFIYSEYQSYIGLYFNGTALAQVSQGGIANASWRNAEVIKTGTNFKMYLDGSLIINYTDNVRTLVGTKFGLGGHSGGLSATHRVRNLAVSTSSGIQVGNVNLRVNGTELIQPNTDSTTAFQVQNASATALLSADTTNMQLTVGGAVSIAGDLTVTNAGNVAFQHGSDFSTVGTSNDVNFGSGVLFRLTGASAQTITGIAGGTDGRMLTLVNASGFTATLKNNDSTDSSAGNLILTGTGSDLSIAPDASVSLIYDSGSNVWRVIGTISGVASGGSYVTLQAGTPGAADSGNFNVSGTGIAATLNGTTGINTGASGGTQRIDASGNLLNIGSYTGSGSMSVGSTGATPILSVGSGGVVIGSNLDSPTIGNEKFTNSYSFSPATGWTAISGSGSSATATHTAAGGTTALAAAPSLALPGGTYVVSYTVSGASGNGTDYIRPNLGVAAGKSFYAASGTDTQLFTPGSNSNLSFSPTTGWTGTITNVSIKSVQVSGAALSITDRDGDTTLQIRAGGSDPSYYNTLIGYSAGENTSGDEGGMWNTTVGAFALQNNVSGASNLALGYQALQYNAAGNQNVGLGNQTLGTNTVGSNNTGIGYMADVGSSALQNATAIGAFSVVSQSDSIVLGCVSGVNGCTATTKVGIGNSSPAYLLDVAGDIHSSTQLLAPLVDTASAVALNIGTNHATQINLNQNAVVASGKTLTVNGSGFDASGNLGIGTTSPGRALQVAVNNTTVNAPQLLLSQAGAGDSSLEFQNSSTSFYTGVDSSDNSFKISSQFAASGSSSTTQGDTNVESIDDFNAQGTQASKFTASVTGNVTSIAVYFDFVDASNPHFYVGLYSDNGSGNSPNARLVMSSQQVAGVGWNTISVPSTAISSGTVYWIAMSEEGDSQFVHNTTGLSAYRISGGYPMPNPYGADAANSGETMSAYVNVTSGSAVGDTFGSSSLFSLSQTGQLTLKNYSNSSAAFQVQNASGTSLLTVDTNGSQLKVGAGAAGEAGGVLLTLDSDTDATFSGGTASNAPTEVNGAMFYSSTNHSFLCGVAGSWETCNGLLYSNTASGSAVSTCTTSCGALASAPIPANYCQAGRVIHIISHGVLGTRNTAGQTLALEVRYGTSATRTGDTLVGGSITTGTPLAIATNISTPAPWTLDYTIICFSTTSMSGSGTFMFQNSITANADNLTVQLPATTTTGMTTTGAANLYLFPVFGSSNGSNTMTASQYIVTGN